MQIQTGTAAVTNGAALVTASAGNDWSQATVGSLFALLGEGVWYTVAAVRAPGLNLSGRWEIDLSAPYAGATNTAAPYAIQKDFTPTLGLPLLTRGDVEFYSLMNRAHMRLESAFPFNPANSPYLPLVDGATITVVCDPLKMEQNFTVSIASGASRTLAITGATDGMKGNLLITPANLGQITLPGSSKVVASGSSTVLLSETGKKDLLAWHYIGGTFYWTIGPRF